MESHAAAPNALIQYAIIALVVVRLAIRELRDRTMNLGRIFIAPAIIAALAIGTIVWKIATFPDTLPRTILLAVVGIALGVVLGVAVGRFTSVRAGTQPNTVIVRGSKITVALWIGALLLRVAAHLFVPTTSAAGNAELVVGLFVIIGSALFAARYAMFRRAQTLGSPAITAVQA